MGTERWQKALALFQKAELEYVFNDTRLLEEALTHSSFAHESGLPFFNERLEFLGDAVLELVVSEQLFTGLTDEAEGVLTQKRASLVCTSNLAGSGKGIGLHELIRLGKGLSNQGGRTNDSICADALEAVFGAVFLDGGLDWARKVIHKVLDLQQIEHSVSQGTIQDPKTRLQQQIQLEKGELPSYQVVAEEGPSHSPTFVVEVWADGERLGVGTGSSRKKAERNAAENALQEIP